MNTSQSKEVDNVFETVSMMKKFQEDGKYCDIVLQVGTAVVKSQRALLAAISEYFDGMLSSNFDESKSCIDKPIVLHDLDAAVFEEILHFAYTGNVCVTWANVYHLLFMSDYLGLRSAYIENQCIEYLQSYTRDPDHYPLLDVFNLYAFSCLKEKQILVDNLSAHICQHLRHFSKDDRFMEMSFKNLNALLKWSTDYILPLYGTENTKLQITLNWINHSRKTRSKHRGELMKNINFSNVSTEFMSSLINRWETLADEFIGIPITEPHKKIEAFESEIENKFNGLDSAAFEDIITFELSDVRQMEVDGTVHSPSYIRSNFSWKINIKRKAEKLGFYLYCEGTSDNAYSSWSCCVTSKFLLLSQKGVRTSVMGRDGLNIFSSFWTVCGYKNFISWNDLINPVEGYIKDNCVIFQVHMKVDVPCLGKNYAE